MCNFFYVGAASRQRERAAGSTSMPLHRTWVKPQLLQNSTATFLDTILYTDGDGVAVAQMWLRVNPGDRHGLDAAPEPSSLVAACHVALVCPNRTEVPVISGAAVLADGATSAAAHFHLVYPCAGRSDASLREVVHTWNGMRLSVTRRRALVSVAGTSAPYAATVVVSEAATTGVFVLESGVHHRTDAFHVRTGAAARQGLVPPVTVLQMRAPLTEGKTQRSFRHGCLSESLVGFIAQEPDRRRSIFSLAAVPSADAHVLYEGVQILLEMGTAAFHDADEALVPCCGLVQRLVYTDCALRRTQLHASPLLEATQVVLTVRVEGALSRSASLWPFGNVTWQLCGSQRYEATVTRLQRPLEGRLSWVVEPLRSVSLGQPCVGSASGSAVVAAKATQGSCAAERKGQMRCVTCAAEEHSLLFSRQGGVRIGGVGFRCSLTPSAGAICSAHQQYSPATAASHESLSCRRKAAMWWHPPPLWLSRTACSITHHSLSELSVLYCLVFIICFLVHLLRRGRASE
ncbi:hypothetical protein LSCM1_05443 [Leishmania martiniquensis]|uniref:Uncharacterized protein n=1 Tax=Leishmania martiniquensis TaxID=1580590 RepID=A0A836G867_9TRYP|nr:hypothetical protein LSCM1_05443 [Leishmania martiniquensis]